MKRQRLVFAVALILIVAGQLITRFAAPETHIFGNVLFFGSHWGRDRLFNEADEPMTSAMSNSETASAQL